MAGRGARPRRAPSCVALLVALACDPAASAWVDGPSGVESSEALPVADRVDAEVVPVSATSVREGDEVARGSGDAEPERSDRPPTDPEAIGRWLRAGGYLDWEPRSAVHRTDEHGGARVLFNPLLAASFEAEAEQHPLGAAAVRELYEADLVTPRGLALMVKVGEGEALRGGGASPAEDEDERGWFWYEVFSFDEGAAPTVAEVDAPGCLGCHSAGVDLVMPPES